MSYYPCLGESEYDGKIVGVKVIWGPTAMKRLPQDAINLGVPVVTLKALTECLLIHAAKETGFAQVNILGGPHKFTTNSSTRDRKDDDDHISGQFSAALPEGRAGRGRYKVHVYLRNVRSGHTAYNNVKIRGVRVVQKNKGPDQLRTDLSWGWYPDFDTASDFSVRNTTNGYGYADGNIIENDFHRKCDCGVGA